MTSSITISSGTFWGWTGYHEDVYYLVTDGSYERGKRHFAKAGWSFVMYDCSSAPQLDTKEIVAAFGPTVVETGTPYWIGARKKSNNTSEMSAMIEALL